MFDVILPKDSSEGISFSLGISGKTLPNTTRRDVITYGLHCTKVLSIVIPPCSLSSFTKDSAAR
jgi:hypothetical protein